MHALFVSVRTFGTPLRGFGLQGDPGVHYTYFFLLAYFKHVAPKFCSISDTSGIPVVLLHLGSDAARRRQKAARVEALLEQLTLKFEPRPCFSARRAVAWVPRPSAMLFPGALARDSFPSTFENILLLLLRRQESRPCQLFTRIPLGF